MLNKLINTLFPCREYRIVGIWTANIGRFMADRYPEDLGSGTFRFDRTARSRLHNCAPKGFTCTILCDSRVVEIFET